MKKLCIGIVLLITLLAIAGFAVAETQLALNTPTTVEIDIRGDVAIYEFTPTVDGIYKFYSSSVNEQEWCYTYGWLFDEDMMLITENEGSEYRYGHFFIRQLLKANKKYYFAATFSPYMSVEGTGSFLIHLDHTDGLFAEATQQTVYSGYGKTRTIEIIAHSPNGAVTYQWYDGDSAISGATSSQYTYPALTANKIYKCAVSDGVSTKAVSVDAKISSGLSLGYSSETEVAYGESIELTVKATASYGADQLTYQWYENVLNENGEWVTEPIEGATSPRLALNNVTQSAHYECAVTDINGETERSYHNVYVSERFTLTAVGETQKEVEVGGSVTLSVSAEAAGPASYSWYKINPDYYEWIPIPNAEGPSYTITNATVSDEYICEAKSAYGNNRQISFFVNVTGAFSASANGSTQIVMNPGETAVMKVNASSNVGALSYQWYYNDSTFHKSIPIREAVSANYSLPENAKVGVYLCNVTDTAGNSKRIYFNVSSADVLSVEADSPTNVTLAPGVTGTLKVAVTSGDENVKIRWYQRKYNTGYRVVIDGARTTSLNIIGGERGDYSCVVTDRYGNTSTVWFYVYVDNGFSVTAETTEFTVLPGESVRLNATGECTDGEITYRWSHNDIKNHRYETVKESNESFLAIDAVNADNCGRYELNAYDEYGNYSHISFNIAVKNNLTAVATNNISEVTVDPGEDVELSVTANCDAGVDRLTYQWYEQVWFESGNSWYYSQIDYEKRSTLRLTNIQESKGYYCMVSDEFGNSVRVNFRVRIDNELTANPLNGNENITVQPGEAATLTVTASCKTGELTYQWYKEYQYEENGYSYWNEEKITGATGASYTTEAINQYTEYYCEVKDAYKNSSTVWFYVRIDNGLTVVPVGLRNRQVEIGTDVTLQVTASCNSGALSYKWYRCERRYDENGDYYWHQPADPIDGANTDTYSVMSVTTVERYFCVVSDTFGGEESVDFNIIIDNGLTARMVGNNSDITVPFGESATLEVAADCKTGNVHYQWCKYVEYEENGQQYGRYDTIAGATNASYTTEIVTERRTEYSCIVQDDYANETRVWFTVYADTELTVEPEGEFIFQVSDAPITLVVTASNRFEDTEFSYNWYSNNQGWISETTDNAYTLMNPEIGTYYCDVSDGGNQSKKVWFYVTGDEPFASAYGNGDKYVNPGEPVTLQVVAWDNENEITYQWYECNSANGEQELIAGETEPIYTLTAEDPKNISCHVTSENLDTYVGFWVHISSEWYFDSTGMSRINIIPEGGNIELTMNITNKLDENPTFIWYRNENRIPDATGKTLTVTEEGRYYFEAHDKYGNSFSLGDAIYCFEDEPTIVAEGQEETRPENSDMVIYRIVPSKTGTYQIETERDVHLYRPGDWWSYRDIYSETITTRLEKGQTYYVMLSNDNSSFKYGLIGEEQNEFNVVLKKGLELDIPALYINNEWIYKDYAISSKQSVILFDGDRMKVLKEGTADVTIMYSNGTQRVFHITVADGNSLILPDQLTTIEEDAFSGDNSTQFIQLGNNVQTVKNGAFSNMGNITVIVNNSNTVFESGAFKNSNPLVICHNGSTEWSCIEQGIPYFRFW